MKTLTEKLPDKYRSAARFAIVGTVCTGLQMGVYELLRVVLQANYPEYIKLVTNLAFVTGFIIEMIANYILTSYYTFNTRPTLKNAGGFLFGRAINFVIQIPLLNVFIEWLGFSDRLAGIAAIALAGIINYFVLLPFYKKEKQEVQKQ